ncbi:UNVERIFIED_CONTAM: hypothetical protein FKN15_028212 [Acipenser sinensis]
MHKRANAQLPPESPVKTVDFTEPGREPAPPDCMTPPAHHTAVLLPGVWTITTINRLLKTDLHKLPVS